MSIFAFFLSIVKLVLLLQISTKGKPIKSLRFKQMEVQSPYMAGYDVQYSSSEINQQQGLHRRLLQTLESNHSNRKLREVNGIDERVKITNTKKYPWNTIGVIRFNSGNSRGVQCTGVLVDDRVVLTAAHCFYSNIAKRFFGTNLTFSPSKTKSSKPYGEYAVSAFSVPLKLLEERNWEYDIGILLLNDTPPITEYMRLPSSCGWPSYQLNIAGYQQDESSSNMWISYCPNTINQTCPYNQETLDVMYVCDAVNGFSGAPLFDQTGEFYIRGIHLGYTVGANKNFATAITPYVYNFINDPFNESHSMIWKNEQYNIVQTSGNASSLALSQRPTQTDNYLLESSESEDNNSYHFEFIQSQDTNNTGQHGKTDNNTSTTVIIVSILSGVSFCTIVVIILLVIRRRNFNKHKKETIKGGGLHIEMEDLSSLISSEIEQINSGFNQPSNWWADIRIPQGVREIPITDLEEVRPLGSGGFAMVYEVKIKDDVRQKYYDLKDKQLAVKIIYKDYIQIKDSVEAFLQEINAMKDLDDNYVVQLIGASLQIRPSIVMELVVDGSLENLLYKEGFKSHETSLQWKLKLILNISKSIQYLHSKGITHRDLKPHNILITDKYQATVKVSDFGLSKIAKAGSSISGARAGTTQYMAPEMCQGKRITKKADIWALGVMMQEIIRGVKPWSGQSDLHIFYQISQLKQPPDNGELPKGGYPKELCSLIKSCWREASRRPSADDIVNTMSIILKKELDQSSANQSNSTSSSSEQSPLAQP